MVSLPDSHRQLGITMFAGELPARRAALRGDGAAGNGGEAGVGLGGAPRGGGAGTSGRRRLRFCGVKAMRVPGPARSIQLRQVLECQGHGD